MALSGADLSMLLAVLAGQAVDVEFTSDIAAGVGLADADLDQFDFAVAVIPAGPREDNAAVSAIYIEIGVAAARELPLLVVVEPPGPPAPALAGLTTVITQMDNEEALRLQLGLFLRWVQAAPRAQRVAQPLPSRQHLVPAAYTARLRAARMSPPDQRGMAFEQLVSDLFRDAGAQVEQRPPGGPDVGVDIAAFIPGEEQRLGTLMVQVKSGTLAGHALQDEQQRLSAQVLQARAGLGLLVYDQVTPGARKVPPAPLVFHLGIDDLLAELEARPLSAVLARARNRAVHGM
jgi:Restriction endonuclease